MGADFLAFIAPETWGPVLKDGVQKEELTVIPYELQLDYNYWAYRKNEHKPTTLALLCSFCLLNSTWPQEK
jgi:hypothetical protein